MIQLAAPPVSASAPASAAIAAAALAGGAPVANGESPDLLGFASFLAHQQDALLAGSGGFAPIAGSTADAAADPAAAPEPAVTLTGARALLQQLAAALQPGGKVLPGAGKPLPAAATTVNDQTAADGSQTPVPADPPSEAAAFILPDPAAALLTPDPVPAPVPTPVPAMPTAPAGAPSAAAAEPSHGQGQTAPLVEAQLLGRPLALVSALPGQQPAAAADTAVAAAPAPADLRVLALDRSALPAAAFAITESAAPQGPAALRLRPMLAAKALNDKTVAAASALTTPDMAAAASLAAVQPAANPAQLAATAPTTPTSGHDFAALVDRLIAARDASRPTGGPQRVNVAVNHADFGPVSLSFHHDAGGLTVSVASPDPDFARAVQAATTAGGISGGTWGGSDLASGQTTGGQQAALGQSASQSHGNGQGRAAPADPRNRSASGNAGAADPTSGDTPAHRRGLFA